MAAVLPARVRRGWRRIRRHGDRGIRALLRLAAVIGAAIVIVSAALYLGHAAKEKWFWRSAEYRKLVGLRAGFDLRYFRAQLGPPFVSRRAGAYLENAFRGRDYFVQTISRRGTVELYAVTSCSRSFRPSFTMAGLGWQVELNRDRLTEVLPHRDWSALAFDYSPGASAPTTFYEGLYGGASGFYKTFIWGVSSVCADAFPGDRFPSISRAGFVSSLHSTALAFRREAVINTFAETAPAVGSDLPQHFGIVGAILRPREINLKLFGRWFYVGPDRVLLQAATADT